jgi:lipid A 3-O-deacylase PagL
MHSRIGLAIALLLLPVRAVCAQDASGWFIRSGITSARVLPSSPFAAIASGEGDPISWVPDLTLEIGRQTDGSEDWHHLYGLPAYGFGFSVARFQNGDGARGRPLEAYTFFSWPFARLSNRFDLTTDFGMGMSWNWRQVSHSATGDIAVLGSDLNARIDWGVYLRYISSSRLSVYSGLDYTHRSNGGVVQPNRGLNVLGPRIAVQYGIGPQSTRHAVAPRTAFHPTWDLLVGGAGGFKNVVEQTDPVVRQNFGVVEGTVAVQRRFYPYGKLVGGTDITYDPGVVAESAALLGGSVTQPAAASSARPVSVGVFGGYEHIIARFSVFVQAGYSATRRFDERSDLSRVYERFGWRFNMSDRLWGTVAVRAIEMNKADFLEVGFGYRIPLGVTRTAANAVE